MIEEVQTGEATQYKCTCGNIYDEYEQALSCEHDFYDSNAEEILEDPEYIHLMEVEQELGVYA